MLERVKEYEILEDREIWFAKGLITSSLIIFYLHYAIQAIFIKSIHKMKGVFPGKPLDKLNAFSYGIWEGVRIFVYLTNRSIVVLSGYNTLIQIIDILHSNGELSAVAFDSITGQIALSYGTIIQVYTPVKHEILRHHDRIEWKITGHLNIDVAIDDIKALSWNRNGELLVGCSHLTFVNTSSGKLAVKSCRLMANPIEIIAVSPDFTLIATVGTYDKLIKLWRHKGIGDWKDPFENAYLRNSDCITFLQWRTTTISNQKLFASVLFRDDNTCQDHVNFVNVLYAVCQDNTLRIWSSGGSPSSNFLSLRVEFNLLSSIKPSYPTSNHQRFCILIDGKCLAQGIEKAVQQAANVLDEQLMLAKLIESTHKFSDVIIVLDAMGNMAAYGIENADANISERMNITNIVQASGIEINFCKIISPDNNFTRLYVVCDELPGSSFSVLAHHPDGRIDWYDTRLDILLCADTINTNRLTFKAVWTGNQSLTKQIFFSPNRQALAFTSIEHEITVCTSSAVASQLSFQSQFKSPRPVLYTCLFNDGRYLALLHPDSLSIWNTIPSASQELAYSPFNTNGTPIFLGLSRPIIRDCGGALLTMVSSQLSIIIWEVKPCSVSSDMEQTTECSIQIEQFSQSHLPSEEIALFVLPILTNISKLCNAVGVYFRSGTWQVWSFSVGNYQRKIHWTKSREMTLQMSLNPTLIKFASDRLAAIYEETCKSLIFVNLLSQRIENEAGSREREAVINSMDWVEFNHLQPILMVGFAKRIEVLAKLRVSQCNIQPSWSVVRAVNLELGIPDSILEGVWLRDGSMIFGSGNSVITVDEWIDVDIQVPEPIKQLVCVPRCTDVAVLVDRLTGSLPVFHGQFLTLCILTNKRDLVYEILARLFDVLRLYAPGDNLDAMLNIPTDRFWQNDAGCTSRENATLMTQEHFDITLADKLANRLGEIELPFLTHDEQVKLVQLVNLLGKQNFRRGSFDDNAYRYIITFSAYSVMDNRMVMWQRIAWAFYSSSQDDLLNWIYEANEDRMDKKRMEESGILLWLKDINRLREQFELLGRSEYNQSDTRDPVACSLHFIALRKKNVLQGLWRLAVGHKEQRAVSALLGHDFTLDQWKRTAQKNAFALVSKRRFVYAAAFFLLGDRLSEAMNVIDRYTNDTNLAIVIARIYEGEDEASHAGPVLREFLHAKVTEWAQNDVTHDRWQLSWVFAKLAKEDLARRVLIEPLDIIFTEYLGNKGKLACNNVALNDSFSSGNPALGTLYQCMKYNSTAEFATTVVYEMQAVKQAICTLSSMGCGILAVNVAHNWKFTQKKTNILCKGSAVEENGNEGQQRRMDKVKQTNILQEPTGETILDHFGF